MDQVCIFKRNSLGIFSPDQYRVKKVIQFQFFISLQIGFNAKISINNVSVSASEVRRYANGKYLHLFGYVNSVKIFLPWIDELKEHILRFKSYFIRSAEERLKKVGCYGEKVTTVSIHVRRGDYRDLLHGIPEAANENYFHRAMEYYSKKYAVG